jgi:lipid-A-disaccharide synthase
MDAKNETKPFRVFISTGDASGDWHASEVAKALKQLHPNVVLQGLGGHLMEAAGVECLPNPTQMGQIGPLAFVLAIPSHLLLLYKLNQYLKQFKPDVVLLIDYGGFHLTVAQHLKGWRKAYYIPPQLWASRKGRMNTIKRYIERVYCIFPFELPLYQKAGVAVDFVGHPLLQQLPPPADKLNFCQENNFDPSRPIVTILPGSRKMELKYLLEPLLQSIPLILKEAKSQKQPLPQFVVAQASHVNTTLFQSYWRKAVANLTQETLQHLTCIQNKNHALLSVSNWAMGSTGTVTLEAALYGVPMLMMYKGPWFSYEIVRRFILVPFLGLPNLLSEKTEAILPEIYQYDITPEVILNKVNFWLAPTSSSYIQTKHDLALLRQRLGEQVETSASGAKAEGAKTVAENLIKHFAQ